MKIHLAGIGTRPELFYNNSVKYTLMSFIDRKKIDINKIKTENLLLDSGAFTYLNSKKNSKTDWDRYIEDYAQYIVENKIENFFELDIDAIIGLDGVERLRYKLEFLTKKKSIPVWHKKRGIKYWHDMVHSCNYIAIGGIVTQEIKKTEYDIFTPLLEIAKEKKVKVHGLGFTNTPKLHKYKFYSVDSTNWITARFNMYYIFDPQKGILISHKKNKGSVKSRVKKSMALEYDKMQINEWIKFSKYAEEYL